MARSVSGDRPRGAIRVGHVELDRVVAIAQLNSISGVVQFADIGTEHVVNAVSRANRTRIQRDNDERAGRQGESVGKLVGDSSGELIAREVVEDVIRVEYLDIFE